MAVNETYSRDLMSLLNGLLVSSESVLDIGSGIGVLLEQYASRLILALDIHRPFLEQRVYKSAHIIPVNANAMRIERLFMPGSIAMVTLIDTIEHFTKTDGLTLLNKAEQIAGSRVIVFTPRGFFPQSVDHYGLSGDRYQTHRSGWEPEEFEQLGYEVMILKNFHDSDNLAFVKSLGSNHPPVDALLAWKNVNG
jgi:hypothetical protein